MDSNLIFLNSLAEEIEGINYLASKHKTGEVFCKKYLLFITSCILKKKKKDEVTVRLSFKQFH
jgi:hypothetical protein